MESINDSTVQSDNELCLDSSTTLMVSESGHEDAANSTVANALPIPDGAGPVGPSELTSEVNFSSHIFSSDQFTSHVITSNEWISVQAVQAEENAFVATNSPQGSVGRSPFRSSPSSPQQYNIFKTINRRIQKISVKTSPLMAKRKMLPRITLSDFWPEESGRVGSNPPITPTNDLSSPIISDGEAAEECFLRQEGFVDVAPVASCIEPAHTSNLDSTLPDEMSIDPDQAALEALELESFTQNSFWVQRTYGADFEDYLEATAVIVGESAIVAFNAEERGRLEITVNSPDNLNRIIATGLTILGTWYKAYRLAEKPVLITVHGVPPIIPHQNICDAIKGFGASAPSDCSFIRAPVGNPNLKHVKSCRRRVWVRTTTDSELPETIRVGFAGKVLPFKITHGMVKCFACGKTGHFRAACRSLQPDKGNTATTRSSKRSNEISSVPSSYAKVAAPFRAEDLGHSPPLAEAWGKRPPPRNSDPHHSLSTSADESSSPDRNPTVSKHFVAPSPPSPKHLDLPLPSPPPPLSLTSPSPQSPSLNNVTPRAGQTLRSTKLPSRVPPPLTGGNRGLLPLPQRSLPSRRNPGTMSREASTPSWSGKDADCLQLASVFLDALQEKTKKGAFPVPALLNLDVDRSLKTFEANHLFFEANSSFGGLGDFILEATEAQSLSTPNLGGLNSGSNKRAASSSDDLSSANSVKAKPAAKPRKLSKS